MRLDSAGWDFERFYKTYAKTVLWEVYHQIGDWTVAEDITQDAFLAFGDKQKLGEVIDHPKAFVLRTAYFMAIRHIELIAPDSPPPEPDESDPLLEEESSNEPTELPASEVEAAFLESWDALVYWGRRVVPVALEGVPTASRKRQLLRLRVLLDSDNRTDALRRLKEENAPWEKTAVSTTIGRYSQKIDRCFEQLLEAGPANDDEEKHWFFLEKVARFLRTHDLPGAPLKILPWMLRRVNRLASLERHHLVFQVFFPPETPSSGARRRRTS